MIIPLYVYSFQLSCFYLFSQCFNYPVKKENDDEMVSKKTEGNK